MKTYHVVLAYEVIALSPQEALEIVSAPEGYCFNIQVEEQVEKEPKDGNAS
jgi:hypothetical protein